MADNVNLFGRFSRYLREVKQEVKKVTWPSREEIVASTVVVLVTVAFFVLLVGGLDLAFSELVKFVAFRF